MKKYLAMVPKMGERYGWGVVLSSVTYVNGLLVMTAGLACFVLCVLFDMFGVQPAPPQETGNPLSWILYLLIVLCYGWFIWSMMIGYVLFPLGAAFSTLDLLAARKTNNAEKYQGAVAGICLAALPIAVWFLSYSQCMNFASRLLTLFQPLLRHHGF